MKKFFIAICVCCTIFLFLSQVLTGILRFLLIPLVFSLISFLGFYLKLVVFDSLIKMKKKENDYKNQKTPSKDDKVQLSENVKTPTSKESKKTSVDNYDTDVKEMYEFGRNLFNRLMKERRMKKENINDLIKLIDNCLGVHIKHYEKYEFENEAKEIYVKMKNFNLNKSSWIEINSFLCGIESNSSN